MAGEHDDILRYRDLIWQMSQNDPRRAHAFAWGILDHLPDARRRQDFLGYEAPASRPVGIRRNEWDGRRTMELRPEDEKNALPPRAEPYYPDRDDGKNILKVEDGEEGRKRGSGSDGGSGDGTDGADAPLDLRDDQADPKDDGGWSEDKGDIHAEPPPPSEEPQTADELEAQDKARQEQVAGEEAASEEAAREQAAREESARDQQSPPAPEPKSEENPIPPEKKPVSKEFLDAIWSAEQGNRKPEDRTTDEKSSTSSAQGKYQITKGGLVDIGWKDRKGNWTEEAKRHGVKSDDDFKKSASAQDKAAQAYFEKKDAAINEIGAKKHIGQEIDGLAGKFKISDAGLAAAAHRDGEGVVKDYLKHQQKNGWKSDFSKIDPNVADKWAIKDRNGNVVRATEDRFRAVETRIRTFENVRYR
ncbi:MAG: hypothetical protein OEL53_09275 [Rhodospirillales bacterium]|nr:hypothetical protein [Rhodospirillales bacterium]